MIPDVRTRILDAAVRLLVEHGGHALTQPKIAAAAGVRQSHLTYYFPKRNDLLLAVTMHWVQTHLKADAQSLQRRRVSRAEVTRYIADAVIAASRVRIILGLMLASEEEPRIKDSLRELVEVERESIGSLLAAMGVQVDAERCALLHAALVGLAVLHVAREPGSEGETRALTERWVDELVPALAKEAPRRAAKAAGGSYSR